MTARDRRAILVGASVMLCATLMLHVVRPFFVRRSAQIEQLRSQGDLLARERALLRRIPLLTKRLEEILAEITKERPRLFWGEQQLATAALSAYVENIAQTSALQLKRIESLEPLTDTTGLAFLRVRVIGEGDAQQLFTFLHRIESGAKLVSVDEIAIEKRNADASLGNRTNQLSVSANLRAFSLLSGKQGVHDGN